MKVLILHQHFNTPQKGGAIRSYYLAKGMLEAGHEVIVVTAHNNRQYKIEYIEGIEVHYLPVPYHNRFGFYRRIFSFGNFIVRSLRLSRRFRHVDICYAISVPLTVGLIAMRLKSRFRIPYIFEVGDLWPDAPIQLGFIRNRFVRTTMLWLERKIYTNADAIVALSDAIAERIRLKLKTPKKISVLPNMGDTDFYFPEMKNAELEKKFSVENKFVISYIGAIGYANGLDYLLACARVCQKAQLPIHFFICGDGAMLGGLKKSSQILQLTNLTFVPFLTREGVREMMNVTDASFVSYRPVEILETGSPNKYFDALASGKLILVNFGGWIKQEIEKYECGVYFDPMKPEDFVTKIKIFLTDREKLMSYQMNARKVAEQLYSRHGITSQLVSLLAEVK